MLSIGEFVQSYDAIGKKKTESGALRLFILGILAGAFIACGAVGAASASFSVENAGLAKLISGTVFPVGLIMVIISGAELFTGNCLLIMPFRSGAVTETASLPFLAGSVAIRADVPYLACSVIAADPIVVSPRVCACEFPAPHHGFRICRK